MKVLIAIDPGINGGIAWREDDGRVFCQKMPDTTAELCTELENLQAMYRSDTFCMVEKTGTYMPGNSGPAAVKFARHCGAIDGVLAGLAIAHDHIAPSKWMRQFLGAVPKDKKQRKNTIKAKAGRLYPHLKVTLATADALGILTVIVDGPHGERR